MIGLFTNIADMVSLMYLSILVALIGGSSAHSIKWGRSWGSHNATSQQIFYGRFISTPTTAELLIQTGAVLVTGTNGTGSITKAVWGLDDPSMAASSLGVSNDVSVYQAGDNGFFFPGFLDTHIHAPQYPNSGLFGTGTLLDWLQAYTFPMEASLSNASSPAYANYTGVIDPYARAQAVYSHVVDRTLSYGTTTASYYASNDVNATNLLADLAYSKGQRAYIGRACMDDQTTNPAYYRDEPGTAINKTLANIAHIQNLDPEGSLVSPIVTPRFALACTPDTLTELGQLAESHNLRIQTHLDENVNEVLAVAKAYPNSTSYAQVYDSHGLLTNKTILAHGVHLTDAEVTLIAARDAGVSHCPASNSALGSGMALVRRMLNAGIKVGLGTDNAGGYSPNILEVARQAFLVARLVGFADKSSPDGQNGNKALYLSVREVLYLGTMGGAKVVGMEGKLGGFDEGMLWDVQEIGLGDIDTSDEAAAKEAVDIFGWEDWEERVHKWLWNGDDRNVLNVWVGGRLVHHRQ